MCSLMEMGPNEKGNVAELAIAKEAARLGYWMSYAPIGGARALRLWCSEIGERLLQDAMQVGDD